MMWYYMSGDSEIGPITASQLRQLAKTGKIARDNWVRPESLEKPVRACKVKGLFVSPPTLGEKIIESAKDARAVEQDNAQLPSWGTDAAESSIEVPSPHRQKSKQVENEQSELPETDQRIVHKLNSFFSSFGHKTIVIRGGLAVLSGVCIVFVVFLLTHSDESGDVVDQIGETAAGRPADTLSDSPDPSEHAASKSVDVPADTQRPQDASSRKTVASTQRKSRKPKASTPKDSKLRKVERLLRSICEARRVEPRELGDGFSRVQIRLSISSPKNTTSLPSEQRRSLTFPHIRMLVKKRLEHLGFKIIPTSNETVYDTIVFVHVNVDQVTTKSESLFSKSWQRTAVFSKAVFFRRGFLLKRGGIDPVIGALAFGYESRNSFDLPAKEIDKCIEQAVDMAARTAMKRNSTSTSTWPPLSFDVGQIEKGGVELLGLLSIVQSFHTANVQHLLARKFELGGEVKRSDELYDDFARMRDAPIWAPAFANVAGNPVKENPSVAFRGVAIPQFGIGDVNLLESFGVNDRWATNEWNLTLKKSNIKSGGDLKLEYYLSLSKEARLSDYRVWLLISDIRLSHPNVIFPHKDSFVRMPAFVFLYQGVRRHTIWVSTNTRLTLPRGEFLSNRGLVADIKDVVRRDALETARRINSNWLWSKSQ